jgi:hypothetical protein
MAIRALTLSTVKEYQSDLDPAKGTDEATVFVIGAIDAFASTYIADRTLVFSDSGNGTREISQMKLNEVNLDMVRFGLKGWRNFRDDSDNDVEFKTVDRVVLSKKYTVVADECLARMDISLIRELANAIQSINMVTKEEAGNSVAA